MKKPLFDANVLRKDFPMLKKTMHGNPLIYFDSAATAQKPQVVIDVLTDFYQNNYGTVHRAIYQLCIHATNAYEDARNKIRNFINAEKNEEIIFTRGTTEAINTVAYSFGKAFIQPGDEVIISETEHHSNIVPWQLMCEDRGSILKVIPVNDHAEIDLDAFSAMLSNKTKLVAIAHVANSTGTIHPVKKVIEMAHAYGAKVLIDGAQSAPHLPIDVQDLNADFYVFSGHKIYGPTGVGVLYGKQKLLEEMPPYQGGGDMIDRVSFAKTTYHALPLKFEAGTPIIAEVIALGAAIDYLNSVGLKEIQEWEHQLLVYATSQLAEMKEIRIIGTAKEKGGIISFVAEGVHAFDIGSMLDLKGIAIRTGHHCAQPTMLRFGVQATCRISFGLYNTKEEVDLFVKALKHFLPILKS